MIGRLEGILLENKVPDVLVDVAGVGYEVSVPLSTGFRLPAVGEKVVLHTHLAIREDAHQLFGFHSRDERSLFRSLIKTSGVGPKLALAILSGMEPDRFVQCIHNDDVGLLVKIPGVGKKTAERLIIEMRDRLKDLGSAAGLLSAPLMTAPAEQSAEADAETALVALGYKPQQATKAIAKVAQPGMTSEALIRAALKQMI
ncbi:MAG: Holliday junction branch migration protein RuvA [Saccharospirillum sp.]